jgi:hypothetical protein
VDDQVSVIDILDTAGTEDHMVMRDQWFRAGDGFLFVCSVDEPSTLQYLCELRVRMLDCLVRPPPQQQHWFACSSTSPPGSGKRAYGDRR